MATEDRSFYQHHGVSIRGIDVRFIAILWAVHAKAAPPSPSNWLKTYLNSDRTIKRKANEAVMAILLEMHYTKSEILQSLYE